MRAHENRMHTRPLTPKQTITSQGLIVDGSHPWEATFSPARPPPLKSLAELASEAEKTLVGYAKRVCVCMRVCTLCVCASAASHVMRRSPSRAAPWRR